MIIGRNGQRLRVSPKSRSRYLKKENALLCEAEKTTDARYFFEISR